MLLEAPDAPAPMAAPAAAPAAANPSSVKPGEGERCPRGFNKHPESGKCTPRDQLKAQMGVHRQGAADQTAKHKEHTAKAQGYAASGDHAKARGQMRLANAAQKKAAHHNDQVAAHKHSLSRGNAGAPLKSKDAPDPTKTRVQSMPAIDPKTLTPHVPKPEKPPEAAAPAAPAEAPRMAGGHPTLPAELPHNASHPERKGFIDHIKDFAATLKSIFDPEGHRKDLDAKYAEHQGHMANHLTRAEHHANEADRHGRAGNHVLANLHQDLFNHHAGLARSHGEKAHAAARSGAHGLSPAPSAPKPPKPAAASAAPVSAPAPTPTPHPAPPPASGPAPAKANTPKPAPKSPEPSKPKAKDANDTMSQADFDAVNKLAAADTAPAKTPEAPKRPPTAETPWWSRSGTQAGRAAAAGLPGAIGGAPGSPPAPAPSDKPKPPKAASAADTGESPHDVFDRKHLQGKLSTPKDAGEHQARADQHARAAKHFASRGPGWSDAAKTHTKAAAAHQRAAEGGKFKIDHDDDEDT